jgi:hypothetical protein
VLSVFHFLWRIYNTHLEAQPLLNKAMTTLVLCSVADVLAQKVEIFMDGLSGVSLDYGRTLRLGVWGFVFSGTYINDFAASTAISRSILSEKLS